MSLKSKIQAVYDIIHMKFIKNKKPLSVMSIEDTLKLIIEKELSVTRYGDGELLMMADQMNESFQDYDPFIAQKLKQVLKSKRDDLLICIPDVFNDMSQYNEVAMKWFRYFLRRKKYLFYRYFDENTTYGNLAITRCYMDYIDKSKCERYFELLKKIWNDKDVVFIEGEFSRLGVGNDLFDNAKSIRRILAPSRNAYLKYDEIMDEARKIEKDALILIALGATATALAYDLTNEGYRVIDSGHIDIEYEWMRMGASEKVPIPSKYVNEAGSKGHSEERLDDEKYLGEIIAKIGTKF